jgi:hypothetical protein
MTGRVVMGASLTLVVLTVVVLARAYTQQPLPTPTPITPGIPGVGIPATVGPSVQVPVAEAGSEKSLDHLLDELEALRVKKAEIEKKEQELIRVIQQKTDKQVERMKKLGINGPAAAPAIPTVPEPPGIRRP